MNPLASYRCGQRLLVCLTVISSIFFAAGCSSNNSTPPINQVGFTNGSLSGTYVFSSQGQDGNLAPLALAGALVADGNGGIKGGTMDIVAQGVSPILGQAIAPGSYSVGADGRGQVSLTSEGVTFTLFFVLITPSHGEVIEFDNNGTGSGTIDLQTPVTSLSQLAGAYAFSMAGADFNDNSLATVGTFTLDQNGLLSKGVQDANDNAFGYPQMTISPTTAALGSGTGPGTLTLTTASFGSLSFDFYAVDATHLKFIETDTVEFLAGDVFSQTDASIPQGPMAFTMSGGTANLGAIAMGGLMTSDGTGNFPSGLEDVNDGGNLSPAQLSFSGVLDAASSGPFGGRVVVNLAGFFPNANNAGQWVIYPSGGGLLMLEMDSANVTIGTGYAQTATSIAASENYGLNLSGINPDGPLADNAQFNATTSTVTGRLDENGLGAALLPGLGLVGTYTPDSPATGRGSINVPSIGTPNGTLNLVYYVVDASTTVCIEMDQQQLSAGIFELQDSSGAAGVAQAQARRANVHSTVRPRVAWRHK
ncbi:MAG: hypothetical protein WA718_07535 [Terriglobales bacterium]